MDNDPTGGAATNPAAGRVLAAVVVGLAALVAYLGLLGWDQKRYVQADGSTGGPYQAWQVLALALAVAVIAGAAGWRGRPWVAASAIAVVLTVCFGVDAATDPPQDPNLWPVGALMLAVGSFAGAGVVAVPAALLARRRQRARTGDTGF